MRPPRKLDGAHLVRHLHTAVVDHAQFLSRATGATPLVLATVLLNAGAALLNDPNVCSRAIATELLRNLLTPPKAPTLN